MAHEKVFTSREHAEWLREQARLKRPYWYGCYYNACTEALLQKKARQYPAHYTEGRMPAYRRHIAAGQIAGDCVNGAIKGAVWSELGRRSPVYASHGCPDKSADGMFEYCKAQGMEWGPINTIPDEEGIAVRMAGHVGVYVGNGEVVEWRGFAYGCVVTKLKGRKWLHWYRLPWTEYAGAEGGSGESAKTDPGTLGARLLKKGMKGEDVGTLQEMLAKLGYDLNKYGADGDFGVETERAVMDFQQDNDLSVDGKYGPKSHSALMEALADHAAQEEENEAEAAPAEVKKHVYVTGGTVNIRSGAGTEYGIVTVVRKGARLDWIATADNGWHAVQADGVSGWIGPKYTEVRG